MNRIFMFAGLFYLSVGLVHAEEYVEISGDAVNVRFSPSEDGQVVGSAYKGMVFGLEGKSGDCLEVALPSGEYRYIHSSLASTVDTVAELTDSQTVLEEACAAYVAAERSANQEAEAQEPDFLKQIDLSRLLVDKYKLEIHKTYDIPPARKGELTVWCATN